MATVSEEREVQGFSEVVVRGYGELIVEQATDPDARESLVVEADEALMPRLRGEVRDRRLVLGLDVKWWEWLLYYWVTWLSLPHKSARYHVTMKEIDGLSISGSGSISAAHIRTDRCALRVSGSGKVRIGEVECQELTTTVSGSGDIELAGTAQRHDIRISGSGSVKVAGLETQGTTVSISGSGNARLSAAQELEVRISGSGDVRYRGQPRISQSISGSGRISQLEQ